MSVLRIFSPASEDLDGIDELLLRRRDLGQHATVRAAEAKFAVGLSIEPIALFVNGAVMPATEQGQIRERGGASVGPVTDVMALAETNSAAREATATVAMVERAPDRRRNRARAGGHLDGATVRAVLHHHPARVARQAPARFL